MIVIESGSIRNIRDFGDTLTKDGRKIRRNKLIRSASLYKAKEEDVSYLKNEHDLDTVIDLRSFREIKEAPDLSYDLTYRHMPIIAAFKDGITHENRHLYKMPDLSITYKEMVTDPEYKENIRKILTYIMERNSDEGAVLWHCSEGKDRCGLISALIMKALDVDEETIFEDYLETNKSSKIRAQGVYEEVLSLSDEEYASAAYKAYIADERYLRSAFDEMGDNFLTDELKIDPLLIQSFKDKVLE